MPDLGTVLPGAALSESLRCQQTEVPLQVIKMSTSALPCHYHDHLLTFQHADHVLGTFLQFWHCNHIPDKRECQTLSKPVWELVPQWDQVVEREGLLYLEQMGDKKSTSANN